ncbi:Hypothetical predicted protein [Cloeon dipterum]|uniref:Uncharacterized protein n=1 Tax=Cloeon dipterum TaxID=197152 RepID=A0A8S1CRH0_9INSE|nr:Hypothetical predicted protein [Cloeon dipterum]
MLATLSQRCGSKRWTAAFEAACESSVGASVGASARDQWLQQQLRACAIPYVKLVSYRISRARQTMDEANSELLCPTGAASGCPRGANLASRRKSCPLRPTNRLFDDMHPSAFEVVRPASACGFYEDPDLPQSPDEAPACDAEELDEATTEAEAAELEASKGVRRSSSGKFTTGARHLLGNVQRSMRKYATNQMAEEPARGSEPKMPNVMKHYARGVSPDTTVEQIGGRHSPGQEKNTTTMLFE